MTGVHPSYVRALMRAAIAAGLYDSARHTLAMLTMFADAAGFAKPSLRELADVTGYHTDTVGRGLRAAEPAGLLTVDRARGRRGNRYQLPELDDPRVMRGLDARIRIVHSPIHTSPGMRGPGTDIQRTGMRGSPPWNARARDLAEDVLRTEERNASPLSYVPHPYPCSCDNCMVAISALAVTGQ